MNITLIGMPGSGKTFIGKILAKDLGFVFFDSDAILEKKYDLPLPEVLHMLGEKQFLEEEAKIIISQTAGKDKLVISPGGSIVYSQKAMEHLKNNSAIVYLKTGLPQIERRIGNTPRAIVGINNKTIAHLYAERSCLYAKWASFTVDSNQTAQKTARDIKNIINKK